MTIVKVRHCIYVFSIHLLPPTARPDHANLVRQQAARVIRIRKFNFPIGRTQPLYQNYFPIGYEERPVSCIAATCKDDIYLLIKLRTLDNVISFGLLNFNTLSKSWSRLATKGPFPTDVIPVHGCQIGHAIFVIVTAQFYRRTRFYKLDLVTREWSLVQTILTDDEMRPALVTSWKDHLVVLRSTEITEALGGSMVEKCKVIVSLFNTKTNHWWTPAITGRPPYITDNALMVEYNSMLIIVYPDISDIVVNFFDLNSFTWIKLDYLDLSPSWPLYLGSFIHIDHRIYFLTEELQNGSSVGRTYVLDLKSRSLKNQCLKGIAGLDFGIQHLPSRLSMIRHDISD